MAYQHKQNISIFISTPKHKINRYKHIVRNINEKKGKKIYK